MSNALTILKTDAEVRGRIAALAAQISADYAGIGEKDPLLVLCTLRGAVFFAADLIRALTVPAEIDFIKVHSCGEGTRPVGSPIFDLGEQISVAGRQVLIVEDIVDTGRTMDTVMRNFRDKGAAGIRICTLLDKPSRRAADCAYLKPEYIGFEIPDLFVVGWGLDFGGRFRLLPDIAVYDPSAEQH